MNLLFAYYYEIRYRLLRWYWDKCTKYSKINGVVLMYHHVTDKHLDVIDSCHHTIEQFKHSLNVYLNKGYRFVTIQEALLLIKERSRQKFAIVTFDDVPLDAYENAVPILEQMQIPFTFFIATGYLGTKGYITKEQLRYLDSLELCTIGSHTITHPMLRNVPNSLEELRDSKKILENFLGHPVNYLAYPYGRQSSVSHKVIRYAERVGYKCAFGTIASAMNDRSSRYTFYLPRIVIK